MGIEQRETGFGKGERSCNLKPVIKRKSLTLMVLLVFGLVATAVVYRYFYYLDAYFYTYEFYWLFNVSKLQAADVAMFAEFFRPMGIATEALPQIIFSTLIQNFYLPFTKPILVAAITSAFGMGLGSVFSFLGLIAVGLISFGLGVFFFGDILPYLKKGDRLEKYLKAVDGPASISFPLLFALPFVPVSVVAIGGAALKISLGKTVQFMLIGFAVRLFLLLAVPSLFI